MSKVKTTSRKSVKGKEKAVEEDDNSLSSFLLRTAGTSEGVDDGLDAIFRSNPIAPPKTVIASSYPSPVSTSKRKADNDAQDTSATDTTSKRRKSVKFQADVEDSEKPRKTSKPVLQKEKLVKVKDREKGVPDEDDAEDEEADGHIEDAYMSKSAAKSLPSKSLRPSKPTPSDHSDDELLQDEDSDDQEDSGLSPLVHESVASQKKSRTKRTKYIPEDETKEERDARTIFIGNLSVEVAKAKPALKALKKHFTSRIPGAKIESVRFRSVAFKNPTAELPKSDEDEEKQKGTKGDSLSTKEARQQERANRWREQNSKDGEDTTISNAPKVFLNPSEKKKVAFIKKEFHDEVDTINCYMVFAHPLPSQPEPRPNPAEIAQQAIQICDNTTFMDRTIRVDGVNSGSAEKKTDPKLTIFVGNLDFGAKEEDVRAFFEGLVKGERGEPKEGEKWIRRVRIVRDKDTQLGKGFAYVEFNDRESVDEVQAMEQDQLKFAKRKLRVQRCKTVVPKPPPRPKTAPTTTTLPQPKSKSNPVPVAIPKGDPNLGEKLKGLDKQARNAIKAADADRIARRLAKKKAKHAFDKANVDLKEKPRKKKIGVGAVGKAKKARVRSDKSVVKKNVKK